MYTASNTTYAPAAKVPGRAGAIARLIVMGLIALISLIASFGSLGEFADNRGFGQALLDAIGGSGTLLITAALIWLVMKVCSTVLPKSFRLANRFWVSWQPLTFLGLYIKVCIYMILFLVPFALVASLFSPLTLIAFQFATVDIDFFSAVGLFLAGGALVAGLGLWDICKLRNVPFKTALAAIFRKRS